MRIMKKPNSTSIRFKNHNRNHTYVPLLISYLDQDERNRHLENSKEKLNSLRDLEYEDENDDHKKRNKLGPIHSRQNFFYKEEMLKSL